MTYREVPDDARPITAGADALAVISPNLDGVDRALMLLHGRYQRLALLSNPPYSHLHVLEKRLISQGLHLRSPGGDRKPRLPLRVPPNECD